MPNVRKYGRPPYTIAVIHGGPGAPGEMAPIAKELSSSYGTLEPLQTAFSVSGQVEELKTQLEQYGNLPIILVGYSWGALLSFILAAQYPSLVKKLILIGCPPLEATYAKNIMQTRLDRLTDQDKEILSKLFNILNNPAIIDTEKNEAFTKIGLLFRKSDAYSPIDNTNKSNMKIDANMYEMVWNEASKLRQDGEFLRIAKMVTCPIVIIRGEYDPHPIEGIKKPLEKRDNTTFIVLQKCGHTPWIEKYAQDDFYRILREELRNSN